MNKIIIVPGNPGSSLLYLEFVEILKHTTNGYEFFILDHVVDKNRNVSLTEQIQNVIDQLNQIIQTGDRVYVIGHSIGAYMVLHALHGSHGSHGSHGLHCKEIAKVILMFPFLEADLSVSRARLLNIVCKCHKSIGMIGGFLSFLPHGFKRALIQYFAKDELSDHTLNTCVELMNKCNIDQYFYLASNYIIPKEFDWNLISKAEYPLVVLACPNDTWMSPKIYRKVYNTIPDKIVMCDDVVHGFVSSRTYCERVAKIIVQHL